MTPQDWTASTRLQDDSLETSAQFDTQLGFQEKHGLLGIVWSDVFLRAFVNKKTGETTYQVYFATVTQAGGWPFFNRVNYEMPGGPEAAELTKVGSDVDCTASRYTGCTYTEHVLFSPSRETLDKVATTYVPNAVSAWKMRLKGQSGQTLDMFMTPAEVQGLLLAVDGYKAKSGLK
ncbi:hypothetical protein [Novosphingobium colocasiae]|uniref:hypothetical protein n=1 Tax=Novosphingobium colocasiae TaxID=1256513 RepID=UPI0035B2110E